MDIFDIEPYIADVCFYLHCRCPAYNGEEDTISFTYMRYNPNLR